MIEPVKLRPRRVPRARADVMRNALLAATTCAVLTTVFGPVRGDASRPLRIVAPIVAWFVVYVIVGLIIAPSVVRSAPAATDVEGARVAQDPDYLRNDLDDSDHRAG